MSNDRLQDLHNQGEQDAASRSGYDTPHGFLDEATTFTSSGMEKNRTENEAYNKGFKNGQKQR